MSGLDLAKKIGLKLCEGKSVFEPVECSLSGVKDLTREKFQDSRAVLIAWQIAGITWGEYDGEKILTRAEMTPEQLFELRIFNETAEIHMKRRADKLIGRYVQDLEGKGNFYVDSFSRFWGEKDAAADGYVNLRDKQRKLQMEIPCAENKFKWYGLLTRNYIDSDAETGLSGYVDYRFVAIEPAGGVEIG